MSRIGKLPVAIPSGVKAAVQNGVVEVEGPKGKLAFRASKRVKVAVDSGKIVVTPIVTDDAQSKADWGTARARILNMVEGVTKGFKKSLEMNGVGFGAKVQGQKLVLSCGFSHDVEIDMPPSVKCAVVKNVIDIESPDLELLGTFSAVVRRTQPPEPYLGKGIKYVGETIRRKAGKAGKK